MKNFKFYVAIAFIATLMVTACSKDAEKLAQEQTDITPITTDDVNYDDVISLQLPSDVKKAIEKMGGNEHDFKYIEVKLPAKKLEGYVVYNDISVHKDEFMKRAYATDDKQYRTEFLVDINTFQTVDLFVYTGPTDSGITGLKPAVVAAAHRAAENWNSQQSNLVFTVTVSNNASDFGDQFETLIGAVDINSSGFAEFPLSDGRPGTFAVISNGINNVSNFIEPEGLEHLITHELGHTIGFRHTDWTTRRSCVDLGIEPTQTTEFTAEWILGTPPYYYFQHNSVMNACFATFNTNGNPNPFDGIALRKLYGYRYH